MPSPRTVPVGAGLALPNPQGAASSAPTPSRLRWLAVAAVAETWRVDEGWWRPTTGDGQRGISRLYFEVVLEEGRALTLFQDLLGEGWYVQ